METATPKRKSAIIWQNKDGRWSVTTFGEPTVTFTTLALARHNAFLRGLGFDTGLPCIRVKPSNQNESEA
jgi:hypothetical protein